MTGEPWKKSLAGLLQRTIGRGATYSIYETQQRCCGYPDLKKFYLERLGQELDLRRPVSFNERITWLKLHDKNPALPIIADKVRARDWIAQRVGRELLVPLVGVFKSAKELRRDQLPNRFMAKINNGSGLNIPVWDKASVDWEDTCTKLDKWLGETQPYNLMEWYQHHIPPRIVVEHLLEGSDGKVPDDYKFYVFHGKVELIYHYTGRYSGRSLNFYRPEWDHLPDISRGHDLVARPRPARWEEMMSLAVKLGGEFPFMRVDFYCPEDRIYIGELTPHPYSGLCEMVPHDFDVYLGGFLDLEKCRGRYWKKRR